MSLVILCTQYIASYVKLHNIQMVGFTVLELLCNCTPTQTHLLMPPTEVEFSDSRVLSKDQRQAVFHKSDNVISDLLDSETVDHRNSYK